MLGHSVSQRCNLGRDLLRVGDITVALNVTPPKDSSNYQDSLSPALEILRTSSGLESAPCCSEAINGGKDKNAMIIK